MEARTDKAVVVTGATSGIGLAVCDLLLGQGFHVYAVGRLAEHCAAAEQTLRRAHPGAALAWFYGDLVHQHEALRVAREIAARLEAECGGKLFGLINNAGCVRSWHMTSDEGYEQQFALNHLAGFLITHELLPQLVNAGGRVLFTASESHRHTRMRWRDVMLQRGYNPLFAYKQSKLCNLLTAYELKRRFNGAGVWFYCVDPGLVNTEIGNKHTGWLVNAVWSARRGKGVPPEVPARTYLYLLAGEPHEGLYFRDCAQRRCSGEVNEKNAARLYALSLRLSGEAKPAGGKGTA